MDEPAVGSALPEGEYAIVELFGHQELVGRIEEVERFGAKMLAIEPLFDGQLLPVVFRGGAAIYGLNPCSVTVAWKRQPKSIYQLPPSIAATLPPKALPPGQLPLELDGHEVEPEDREEDWDREDEDY